MHILDYVAIGVLIVCMLAAVAMMGGQAPGIVAGYGRK
jgi:hypothetical protein